MRTTSQSRTLLTGSVFRAPKSYRPFMADFGYHVLLWIILAFVYLVGEIHQFHLDANARPHSADEQRLFVRDGGNKSGQKHRSAQET